MSKGVSIHDIRRGDDDTAELRAELISGLLDAGSTKHLPPILLWDEKGQDLFEDITLSPHYYPYRVELELLNSWNEEIIESVEPGTVIIELGAGNCKKTGVLLQALHRQKKPISYFALDVAAEPLIHSLSQMIGLLGDSQYISCQGLLGSYENCMMLLEEEDEAQRLFQRHHQHHQHQPLLFLWLGNSITNMPWEASVDSLHRLLRCPRSKLLASIDGNQDTDAIYMAYDPPEGELRRFVRNGLYHANRLLGEDVFEGTDWDYEGVWDPVTTEHRLYHVAKRDLLLTVDGHVVAFSKGQRLHAVTSAKWTASRVQELCAAADVVVKSTWVESVHKFGCYLLSRK